MCAFRRVAVRAAPKRLSLAYRILTHRRVSFVSFQSLWYHFDDHWKCYFPWCWASYWIAHGIAFSFSCRSDRLGQTLGNVSIQIWSQWALKLETAIIDTGHRTWTWTWKRANSPLTHSNTPHETEIEEIPCHELCKRLFRIICESNHSRRLFRFGCENFDLEKAAIPNGQLEKSNENCTKTNASLAKAYKNCMQQMTPNELNNELALNFSLEKQCASTRWSCNERSK